ncbi:hypothetical protein [Halorientalis halophila]|uniref:hypothetical protein n=1 Tax=Halorientalis halophila TaxID=3108499 RepID=UPI00300BC174
MSRLTFTLHGDQADRFEEIQEEIEETTGHSVTRPRVISEMMEEWSGTDSR